MRSLCVEMSVCSLSGRGHGHVSFLHCGLRKFRHSKSSVYRWYPRLARSRFVYDTYRTTEGTGLRHGWVHMFITHCPTVTLQLHNFDLFRTCRTSSFYTVAWQLARFQLTRSIARSVGDSWASCKLVVGHMTKHVKHGRSCDIEIWWIFSTSGSSYFNVHSLPCVICTMCLATLWTFA